MLRKETIFTLTMAGFMSLSICLSNAVYAHGINSPALLSALAGWWFEYLTGFTLVTLFVSRIALKITDFLLSSKHFKLKTALVMPTTMVCFMVPLMSALVQLRLHGYTPNFPALYFAAIKRNFIFAWCAQVLFVGPLVKALFSVLKHRKRQTPPNASVAAE